MNVKWLDCRSPITTWWKMRFYEDKPRHYHSCHFSAHAISPHGSSIATVRDFYVSKEEMKILLSMTRTTRWLLLTLPLWSIFCTSTRLSTKIAGLRKHVFRQQLRFLRWRIDSIASSGIFYSLLKWKTMLVNSFHFLLWSGKVKRNRVSRFCDFHCWQLVCAAHLHLILLRLRILPDKLNSFES